VSHMGPSFLSLAKPSGNPEADHASVSAIVESLTCGDIRGLKPGRMRYTLLLNDGGGVLDDLMVARPADETWSGTLYIVVNADTKEADFARFRAAADGRAELNRADDGGLLALQGPEAVEVIRSIVPAAADLGFMTYGSFPFQGTRLVISRSGYTGEDGFEILVPPERAASFWDRLLKDERVRPIGLGARDSLRLEAGLPLYGHELDETTSPVEADLGFAIAKRRREEGGFPGADRIMHELRDRPSRKRVGLMVEGKAPARDGTEIRDAAGRRIGIVTSGGFGPTVGGPIAMGYVEAASSAPGTGVTLVVRGKDLPARIVPLPFVPHRYFRKSNP
jgi:aminomethyltransferase